MPSNRVFKTSAVVLRTWAREKNKVCKVKGGNEETSEVRHWSTVSTPFAFGSVLFQLFLPPAPAGRWWMAATVTDGLRGPGETKPQSIKCLALLWTVNETIREIHVISPPSADNGYARGEKWWLRQSGWKTAERRGDGSRTAETEITRARRYSGLIPRLISNRPVAVVAQRRPGCRGWPYVSYYQFILFCLEETVPQTQPETKVRSSDRLLLNHQP